jgi:hypothetical protein
MIPLPRDASATDIDQWCNRGVVMVDTAAGIRPAWFCSITPGRSVEVRYLDDQSIEVVLPTALSVHWPICGSVNIPGKHYAVHAARQAQRQYRRTWHVAGLDVTTPRGWDVAKFINTTPRSMAHKPDDLARACFLGTYLTYSEAEALLGVSHVSVALNPRLIVAGDASGKRMFYYNGQLAATASDGVLHPVGEDVPVKRIMKALEGLYVTANI